MNSACAQTSGMAEPDGRPGNRLCEATGSVSHTCSGISPERLLICIIACSRERASDARPATSS